MIFTYIIFIVLLLYKIDVNCWGCDDSYNVKLHRFILVISQVYLSGTKNEASYTYVFSVNETVIATVQF